MIKLRGISWDHPRGVQALHASVQPYAQQFGVMVEWEARSLKDFGDAPIDELAQAYDLLIVDHPHVGLAEATQCLVPLDAHIPAPTLATLLAESTGPSHPSYHYGGHQWALAIDAAAQVSVYRPDLFEGDFPQDWAAVIDLGAKLRGSGRWVGLPLLPTDAVCSFLTLCASLGDPLGQTDGTLLQDESIGIQALEILIAMKEVSHPDSLAWNPIYMLNHMSQHDDLVYCPLTFSYTNYSRVGFAPHLLNYTNIPGVRGSILGGTGYAVSPRCQHIEAAVAYGVWLCGAEIQKTLYMQEGGQPGNVAAWLDEQANALTHHFFQDTLETLKNAYVRPRYHGYHIFQEKTGDLIHTMLRDATPPAACLQQIKALYQQTLMGYQGH